MKQLYVGSYGPAEGPAWGNNAITSQWRHTVANLKQISDWTHPELTAQRSSNQPARYG